MAEVPMDPTRLLIRWPTFQGIMNRRFAGWKPHWAEIGHIDHCSPSGGVW